MKDCLTKYETSLITQNQKKLTSKEEQVALPTKANSNQKSDHNTLLLDHNNSLNKQQSPKRLASEGEQDTEGDIY
jgi:hypothetical protein